MKGARSVSVVLPAAKVALTLPCGTNGVVDDNVELLFFRFASISAASSVSPDANAACASSSQEVAKINNQTN